MVMRDEYRPYAQVDTNLKRRVKFEARSKETTQSTIIARALREYFERKDDRDE